MNTKQTDKLVGCCGLYCGNCGMYKGRVVANIASDFKELIDAHRFQEWVPKYEKIDFSFDDFQKGITFFSNKEKGPYCQMPCKKGGGPPFCEIRPCAINKGIVICFECDEFPCKLFSQFLKGHPEIIEEEKKFKNLGMKKWIELKEVQSKKGFAHATKKYYKEGIKEK